MTFFGRKIRKKHRIAFYSWVRWICLFTGLYLFSETETSEETITIIYSFSFVFVVLTISIDNLTWRKGWNKYFKNLKKWRN